MGISKVKQMAAFRTTDLELEPWYYSVEYFVQVFALYDKLVFVAALLNPPVEIPRIHILQRFVTIKSSLYHRVEALRVGPASLDTAGPGKSIKS